MKAVKKTPFYYYILFFLLLQVPLSLFMFNEMRQRAYRYQEEEIGQLTAEYQAVAASFGRMARLVFDGEVNTAAVRDIIRQAGQASEPERARLRQQLLDLLGPTYEHLAKQNFRQMHFHLPDGTSFLRLHRPTEFGDALLDVRPSVRLANTEQRYVEGFEVDRNSHAFRYVFPLKDDTGYLGSVEISVPFYALRNGLLDFFAAEYFLLLDRNIANETLLTKARSNFIPSDLDNDLIMETADAQAKDMFGTINHAEIEAINDAVRAKTAGPLRNKQPFATGASTKSGDYLVVGVPLYNVAHQAEGFLVSYASDSTMVAFRHIALITYGAINILVLLLLLLHIKFSRAMYARLRFQQNLIDAIPTPICFKNKNSELRGCNSAFAEAFGCKPVEMVGKTTDQVYSDEVATAVHLHDMEVLDQGGRRQNEFSMFYPDGTIHDLVNYTASFADDSGRIIGVIGSTFDVTARNQAEKDLQRSHQELHQIFNTAADGMRIINNDFEVLLTNDTFARITGLTKEAMVGRKCYDVFYGSACKTPDCPLTRIMSGERRIETETLKKRTDGRLVSCIVTATPYRDLDGNPTGIIEGFRDISSRLQSEEALRTSEERYRDLFENATDLIQIVSPDGRLLYVNQAWRAMFGYQDKEIMTLSLADIIHPDDRASYLEIFQRVLVGERVDDIEAECVSKDGAILLTHGSATAQLVKGLPISVRYIFRDITRQRQIETALEKSRHLESIGTLAGGLAHDFNNLLTVIMGNISLARTTSLSAPVQDMLMEAETASQRARNLTMQLITFSQGGTPIKTSIAIARLLHDTAEFVLSGSKVKCIFDLPDDVWQVTADAGQLNEVIHNLITNAAEAMPNGGTVTLRARNVMVSEQEALSLPAGRYVRVSIIDHGIGIPPDEREKIFDPYYSTKMRGCKKGMGMGLAICHSIVTQHGGHIEVESEEGHGTTFRLLLPAVDPPPPGPEARAPLDSDETAAVNGRILLMDDEASVREIVAKMLELMGYQVDLASDGQQAIDLYVAAREKNMGYDVVIMDLTVPGGMGGAEAFDKLRRIDPDIKAVVSSGYANDPIMAEYGRYGFQGAATKPFNMNELDAVLRQARGLS